MSYEPLFSSHCPTCGEVELGRDELWLVLPSAGAPHFDFVCPECRQLVRSLLDEAQVDLLATLVAVEELDIPDEALEVHDGPALTADDLIDLMLALEDWDAVGPASYAT